jgi:4'-phosphopantetheinyl transferase
LWRIPTGSGGAPLEDLSPLLSPWESDRSKKLRFVHHRERYVRAHAGLRKILASYVKINPQHIAFKFGEAGKPLLDAPESGIEFNMTTSGDLALVAVSAGEPVGVDCEQVRERISFTAIAERMFTPDEASRIATARQDDRPKLFHVAWTALEAEVKADGRGLAHHKESTAQGILDIGHCIPECGFVAAVARRYLPPVEEWITLELAAS